MTTTPELIQLVQDAIDRDLRRRGLRTYQELADVYGVSTKTIWEWRTGVWTKADTALIQALTQYRPAAEPVEA